MKVVEFVEARPPESRVRGARNVESIGEARDPCDRVLVWNAGVVGVCVLLSGTGPRYSSYGAARCVRRGLDATTVRVSRRFFQRPAREHPEVAAERTACSSRNGRVSTGKVPCSGAGRARQCRKYYSWCVEATTTRFSRSYASISLRRCNGVVAATLVFCSLVAAPGQKMVDETAGILPRGSFFAGRVMKSPCGPSCRRPPAGLVVRARFSEMICSRFAKGEPQTGGRGHH